MLVVIIDVYGKRQQENRLQSGRLNLGFYFIFYVYVRDDNTYEPTGLQENT